MAEYKLLDPNRKAVLQLPATALKLWLAYWMFESDGQEAYPSLDRLEEVTGMQRNTILKTRKYLVETGWLLRLDGYASSRYSKPTRGSHSVAVYRVDDPITGKGVIHIPFQDEKDSPDAPIQVVKGVENEPLDEKGCKIYPPHEMHPRFISVSTSLPVSLSEAVTAPAPSPAVAGGRADKSLRDSKTPSTSMGSEAANESKLKSNAKYDAPFPYDFNSWSQPDRTAWCMEHSLSCPSVKDSASQLCVKKPPKSAASPAPALDKVECPYCPLFVLKHRLDAHVRKSHEEWLDQWEERDDLSD